MKRLSINVVLWIVLFTNIGCNKITKFKSKNKYSDSICTEEKENIERETFCKICEKSTKKYCGRCKKVYYCTVLCQKKDWENHKKECYKKKTIVSRVVKNNPFANYQLKFLEKPKHEIKEGLEYYTEKMDSYFLNQRKELKVTTLKEFENLFNKAEESYFKNLPKILQITLNMLASRDKRMIYILTRWTS